MADDFLTNLSKKDEVKQEGVSPFAKKKSEKQRIVRISDSNYEILRERAFKNKTTIFKELDNIISNGFIKEKEENN